MKYNNVDELLSRISRLESENKYMQEKFMKINEIEKDIRDQKNDLKTFLKQWNFQYSVKKLEDEEIVDIFGMRVVRSLK